MKRNKKQVYTEYLVLQCQAGDGAAFESLVHLWQGSLSKFAFRMTGASHAVGDVMQDVWIAVSKQLYRLNDPACFKRWIYRIVSNKCVDWIRQQERKRKLHEGFQSEEMIRIEGNHRIDKSKDLVKTAIAELPYEQRLLVTLFYVEGFGVSEIAETLNVPEGTVKSRLHKVRQTLKTIIKREM